MRPAASWKGRHVIELKIAGTEVDVKRDGRDIFIRMDTDTAQGVYEALVGLVPTLQPFEELIK